MTETATREWKSDIKDLGEKIVGLTLLDAQELSDYLKEFVARPDNDRFPNELARRKVCIVIRRLRRRRGFRLAAVRIQRADIRWRRISGSRQARFEVGSVGVALGPAGLGADPDFEHVVNRVAFRVDVPVGIQQFHAPKRLVVRNDAITVEVAVAVLKGGTNIPPVAVPGIAPVAFHMAQLALRIVTGIGTRAIAVFPGRQALRKRDRLCADKQQSSTEHGRN